MLFVFYKKHLGRGTAPFTWTMIFNLENGSFIARHRLFNVKCAKYFSLVNVIFYKNKLSLKQCFPFKSSNKYSMCICNK